MGELSKYAAKQKAKAAGAWEPPESAAPSRARAEEPNPDGFADLGKLPQVCADAFRRAVEELKKAASVAAEMERRSANGVQLSEPRSLKLAADAAAKRLKGFAKRAERVISEGAE